MVDHAIVVTVTPTVTPTGPTAPYVFAYSDNGGTPSTNGTLHVLAATSETFLVSIMANGEPGDTCVFPDPSLFPLEITEGDEPWFIPEWLKDFDSTGISTISFTDDNTNQHTRNYLIKIRAVYNGTSITSPDPTIINDGTNIFIEGELQSSRPQPQPVVAR